MSYKRVLEAEMAFVKDSINRELRAQGAPNRIETMTPCAGGYQVKFIDESESFMSEADYRNNLASARHNAEKMPQKLWERVAYAFVLDKPSSEKT